MRILYWFIGIVTVLALVLWLSAGAIAERAIGYVLGKQDITVKSYRIVTLSRSHVVLADVVAGDNGEVKAGGIDLRIGWEGKQAKTFDVTLTDADITLRTAGGDVMLDGLERLWEPQPILSGGEPITVRAQGKLVGHYALDGALEATAENIVLQPMQENTALLMPLTLNGKLAGKLNEVLAYDGTLISDAKQVHGRFNGSYDMAKQTGTTQWAIEPMRFAPKGFTFAQLSPLYAGEVPTFPMRVSAKGSLKLAPKGWTLAPNITFLELPLGTLLASVLGDDATVDGMIAGSIPLRITPTSWRIDPARLSNKGGLRIAVSPVGSAADMLQTHPQSQIVLGALANFQVDDMSLDARSTDNDGNVSMKWHFLGANPDFYGGKKVDFTLAVNANLEDIWLSATQAEKLADKASQQGAKR